MPFIPNSYSQVTDKTFNKLAVNDTELRDLFEEILGYALFRRNEYGKFFILTGGGVMVNPHFENFTCVSWRK